mgnify:FL=1
MDIIIDKLSKAYGSQQVLQDFSAVIPLGKTTGIMAPSGYGKTTLLRILMGLEQLDGGTVQGLEGLRQSAVFQEDRLCENLSAAANIRLVCPRKSPREIMEALAALELAGCAHQPARELSGGMRRRVALLRALMADYDILYLDEPFKGLDVETKAEVIAYTRKHIDGKTVLLVTHDLEEAQALGAHQILELRDH